MIMESRCIYYTYIKLLLDTRLLAESKQEEASDPRSVCVAAAGLILAALGVCVNFKAWR